MKKFPLLFLLFCFLSAAQFPLRAEKFVDEDDREINIKLKGVDGNKYDLSKMRGNYVLVAFGATWCGPCHEELRDLEILHREFKDRPIKFVWVSVDDKEQMSDGDLRRFAQTLDFTFPVLRDPDKRAYKQFSERTRLPLLVIFDKEGRVLSPNQFGAASQPGVFRINLRKRLQKLFLKDREALEAVRATDALEN
ncbi:MAG: TlpA family protein disulfide reductase [Pyrinomonadaceae bacterium]|nr:TlpA family protein disulfide reductase [Pyrinomonadaceae bacterium]